MCEREVGGLLAAGGFAVRELPLGASRPTVSEQACAMLRGSDSCFHTQTHKYTHTNTHVG